MDKNSTPKRLPGTGKKSGDEGLQEKGQEVRNQALSLYPAFKLTEGGKEIDLSDYKMEWTFYKLPETSGFKMARRV